MPDDHRRPRLPWPRSGLVPAGKVGRGHLIVRSARNPTGTTRASTPAAALASDTGRPSPTRPTAARVGAASPSRGPPATPWHQPGTGTRLARQPPPRLASLASLAGRSRPQRTRPAAGGSCGPGRAAPGPTAPGPAAPGPAAPGPAAVGSPGGGRYPHRATGRAGLSTTPGQENRCPRPAATPRRGCGCARQSTSPCGRNGGGWRSPGAPAARAVAAGGRNQQDDEDEGGADEGQAGGVVGAGSGAAEAGVDALRGRDRVVGG